MGRLASALYNALRKRRTFAMLVSTSILFWIMNNLQQLQPQVFELELVVQGQWQAVGGCALPKKI